MRKIILTDGLVDVVKGNVLRNKAIVIEDHKISDIIEISEISKLSLKEPEQTKIIDAKEKFIIPGLIDSHLHLNFSGGNSPLQDFLNASKEDLYDFSLKNSQDALENGITTVRDCGSISDVTLRLRDEINSGEVIGARILTSGEAITTRKGHIYFVGIEADNTEEMIEAADHLIDKGVDFIKLIVSGGNMTPGSSDQKDQYSYEEIKGLLDHVHSRGKKVMAHIHTKEGMLKGIQAGIDFIEHGSWRVESGIDVQEEKIKEMNDKGILYCTALPKSYTTNFQELHKNRVKTTIMNMKYLDNVVLGTDAGTTNNSVEGLIDQAIYLHEAGNFSNSQILRMMTLNPGKLLSLNNLGILEKGKTADIVALEGNPLADLENLKKVALVIKEGKIVVKNGEILEE